MKSEAPVNRIKIALLGSAVFVMGIVVPNPGFAQTVVGNFVSFDVPGATLTRAIDVNSSGVIVGRFDNQTGTHGFMLAQGTYTAVDFPGSDATAALGINDTGQIVGRFASGGVDH